MYGFICLTLTQAPQDKLSKAIEIAIQSGYRHVDCATAYGNEKEVGEALAKAMMKYDVKREELFITTKVGLSIF